jgi:holo-[acyl-carrier protein] synthase
LSGTIGEHLRAARIHVSLTHDGPSAAAVAVIEGPDPT